MSEYIVRWEIEVTADSDRRAAELARQMQLDPTALVGYFEVRSDDRPDWRSVDLTL